MAGRIDSKWIRRGGCLGISAFFLIAIIILVTRVFDFPIAARGFDHEWSRAQKNKFPFTRDDLSPRGHLSSKENAAPELLAISNEVYEARKKASTKGGRAQDPKKEEVNRELEPYLDRVVAAVQKPYYVSNKDWDEGLLVLFQEYSVYRLAGITLNRRAVKRLKAGQVTGAIHDLQATRKLAKLIPSDGIMVALMVGARTDESALNAIEDALPAIANEPDKIQMLRTQCVERFHPSTDIRRVAPGEIYVVLSTLRNVRRYGGAFRMARTFSRADDNGFKLKINRRADLVRSGEPKGIVPRSILARSYRIWNDIYESEEWKSGDTLRICQKLDDLVVRSQRDEWSVSRQMANIFFPVFGAAGVSLVKVEAKQRTLRALMLVMEYRARNGKYPEMLKDAGAEIEDPFQKGQPLNYQFDGKTVKIWSVARKKDPRIPQDKDDLVTSQYPPLDRSKKDSPKR